MTRRVAETLAGLPQLQDIDINIIERLDPAVYPTQSFPRLRSLEVIGLADDCTRLMSCISSPQLRRATVRFTPAPSMKTIFQIFATIAASSAEILEVINQRMDPEETFHIQADDLRPLLRCHRLKNLQLYGITISGLQDPDFEAMAAAWPQIEARSRSHRRPLAATRTRYHNDTIASFLLASLREPALSRYSHFSIEPTCARHARRFRFHLTT